MADEPIGSVRVDVVADYSKFAQGVKDAADQGAQAGAKIAAAFTAAVSPAGTLTEATNRLKSAQAALTSEGAKMLAQVQATSPGYQAAQSALASLNAEVEAAQQQLTATAAAEQERAAAAKATANAAQQAAAAQREEAAATQAAADAARSAAVVEELLGSATRTSSAAFTEQARAAAMAAAAVASGSTTASAAATALQGSALSGTAAARANSLYSGSVAGTAQAAGLAAVAQAQLTAAMTTGAGGALSAAQAQQFLSSSTAASTQTLNTQAAGTASSTASLGANANAALSGAAAQRQMVSAGQAMAAAQSQITAASTASTGAIMANANATLNAANANNQLVPAQNNAAASGFRLLIVLGLIKKALNELDEVRKSEMELLHLSEATGISAQTFAQFQGAINRAGGDGEVFGKAIVFLTRSIEQGERGVKTMSDELRRLGVTSKDPIEAFYQIADTLHNTKDKSEALAAASRVLGRGEQELIGIMGQGSASLREYAGESKELATARVAALESARQLTAVEAELKAQLTEMAVSVLPVLAVGLKVIATAFSVVNIAVKFAVSTILEGFRGAIDAAKNFGVVISDLAHGKWDMVRVDAAIAMDSIRDHAAALAKDVEKRTGESVKFISDLWTKAAPSQTPGAGNAFPAPAVKFDKGPENELRHKYQEELADLKADHELTIKEELDFWQTRFVIVQSKGAAFADLAREIHRTIGTLNQQKFKAEGREFNRADDETYKEIEQRIKEAQEAAREAGGHPAKLKLDQLIDLTSSDNGLTADTWKKLYDQIPAAQKEADKEATSDLKRFLNEQDQAWLESGNRTATQIKARAEATRSQLEELRPFFVGIDALIDGETAKIIAANKRIEAEKLRVADLQATNSASGGQAEIQSRRIALESAYALQANHTFQEQIQHQRQLAALEAEGLVLKRDKADADYKAAVALGDEVKIQQALNEQAAASRAIDLQAEQSAASLLKLRKDLSFSGQLTSGLNADAQSAVSRLSSGIATLATQTKGWGQEFKTILKDIEKSIVETFARAALLQGLNALQNIGRNQQGGGGVLGTAVGAASGAAARIGGAVTGTAQAAAQTANTAALTADTAALVTNTAASTAVVAAETGMLAAMTAQAVDLAANTVALAALTAATVALSEVEAVNAILPFAAGGDPPVGVPSLVGERGPELFIPKTAGTIIPADKTKTMLQRIQESIGNFQIPQGSLDIPQVASSATISSSQAHSISSSSASAVNNHNTGNIGTAHFNIYESRNPRQTVREIASYMKLSSPKFSPANS